MPVEPVEPVEKQFTSKIFIMEKENGSSSQHRPMINLKALNRFVESTTFKMESLQIAKSLLQPGDYMMKLDLKHAYCTAPVYVKHRRHLQFILQDKLYEFHCLPLRLTSAPRPHSETGEVLSKSDTTTDLPRRPTQLSGGDLIASSGERFCSYNDCQGSYEILRNFSPHIMNPSGMD